MLTTIFASVLSMSMHKQKKKSGSCWLAMCAKLDAQQTSFVFELNSKTPPYLLLLDWINNINYPTRALILIVHMFWTKSGFHRLIDLELWRSLLHMRAIRMQRRSDLAWLYIQGEACKWLGMRIPILHHIWPGYVYEYSPNIWSSLTNLLS